MESNDGTPFLTSVGEAEDVKKLITRIVKTTW
jgi:hypothetical protein